MDIPEENGNHKTLAGLPTQALPPKTVPQSPD
jgi:hypothetical protein